MITVPNAVLEAMLVHADNESPNEACGLVAGEGTDVRFFYPLTNIVPSPVSYEVDPAGHFGALRHAERSGWRLLGVFHTHPASSAEPSASDVAGALEPAWFHLILGEEGIRAWIITDGQAGEQPLELGS